MLGLKIELWREWYQAGTVTTLAHLSKFYISLGVTRRYA